MKKLLKRVGRNLLAVVALVALVAIVALLAWCGQLILGLFKAISFNTWVVITITAILCEVLYAVIEHLWILLKGKVVDDTTYDL